MLAYSAVANAAFGAQPRLRRRRPGGPIFYARAFTPSRRCWPFAALAGRGPQPLLLSDIKIENLGRAAGVRAGAALLSLAGIPPLPGF